MSGISIRLVLFIFGILSDSEDISRMMLLFLVRSRLDYYNSLFRSLSALDLNRLQCAQNSLSRTVANTAKYWHITPVTKGLH